MHSSPQHLHQSPNYRELDYNRLGIDQTLSRQQAISWIQQNMPEYVDDVQGGVSFSLPEILSLLMNSDSKEQIPPHMRLAVYLLLGVFAVQGCVGSQMQVENVTDKKSNNGALLNDQPVCDPELFEENVTEPISFPEISGHPDARKYEFSWTIYPETVRFKDTPLVVTIPVPQTNTTYQKSEWQVDGVESYNIVEVFGNKALQVKTINGKPFRVRAAVSVISFNYDEVVKNSNEDDYPKNVKKYLKPSDRRHYVDNTVAAIVETLKGNNRYETIKATQQWVNDNLRYIRPDDEHLEGTSSNIIKNGYGHCENLSTVAITLLRANGIPARYVRGHGGLFNDTGNGTMHTIVEYYVSNVGWIPWDHGYEPFQTRSTYVKLFHYNRPKERHDLDLRVGFNCECVDYKVITD